MTEILYFVFIQQSAWLASGISLAMMYAMGDRRWWAPYLGIVGQIPWACLAWYTQQWGLLPAVVLYAGVHSLNAWKWRHLRKAGRSA